MKSNFVMKSQIFSFIQISICFCPVLRIVFKLGDIKKSSRDLELVLTVCYKGNLPPGHLKDWKTNVLKQ